MSVAQAPSRSSPKLVLVADDDASVRTLVSMALAAKGYEVEQAADGLAASELLGAMDRLPDLLICDVMMPTIDGLTLARFVKAEASLRAIPIIMLSARTEAETVVHAIGLGVRHYVQKPFSLKELLEKVDRSLHAE